jgi:hypothetical protein
VEDDGAGQLITIAASLTNETDSADALPVVACEDQRGFGGLEAHSRWTER